MAVEPDTYPGAPFMRRLVKHRFDYPRSSDSSRSMPPTVGLRHSSSAFPAPQVPSPLCKSYRRICSLTVW
jgi:MoxR-like ATPase